MRNKKYLNLLISASMFLAVIAPSITHAKDVPTDNLPTDITPNVTHIKNMPTDDVLGECDSDGENDSGKIDFDFDDADANSKPVFDKNVFDDEADQDILNLQNFGLTPEEEKLLLQEIFDEIDDQIARAKTQLQKIDSTLEELAQLIQNGIVKTKNKSKLILQIKASRTFIGQITGNHFTDADMETVNFLLTISKHLIDTIYQSIRKGLKNIPEIDIEHIIPKTKITSLEQLEEKFYKNEKNYEKLEKKVQGLGLSWGNWLYRKLVVSPLKTARRYRLGKVAKFAAVGGLALGYILYRFDYFKDSEIPFCKNVIGEVPEMNEFGHLANKDEIGALGSLEHVLTSYLTGRMPIATLFASAIPFLFYRDLVDMKDWTKDKVGYAHHKLMGGVTAKKATEEYNYTNPRYTFDDVVGLEHVKKELRPLIEYIVNCSRFDRVGIGPEKGYLFAGRPGTGKSFMAEALAGEIKKALAKEGASQEDFRFIPFEASEIYDIISAKGTSDGIDAILEFAMERAPCIIFFDEPDLLGLQRTANKDLLSKLLNAMNGFLSNNMSENVILLAATNRPDNLDPALLRRGRLGKIINFEYPTTSERRKYLERKLDPIVANLYDFDIEKIARETEGATFEGLQSMVRKAFQNTKILGVSLTQKALETAMNEEIRQILPDIKNLSEKELQIVAAQQAAYSLANILLNPADQLACVTISPVLKRIRESAVWDRYYKQEEEIVQQGKMFTCKYCDTSGAHSKEDMLKNCTIDLVGDIGQEIILGSCGHTYNKEAKERALKTALILAAEGINL
ncbi:AAA family ATPase, partial [Candidatus Dependentiae bacterium]